MLIEKLKDNLSQLNDIVNKITEKTSISQAIVEKDFWVVTILDWIFNKSRYKDFFVFKGGTNLSKTYKMINRFSEDIDLILDWTKIGITDDDMQQQENSTTSSVSSFLEDSREKQDHFFETCFMPDLKKYLSDFIGVESKVTGKHNRLNYQITFLYPTKIHNNFLSQGVIIEASFVSSLKMNEQHQISSFIYDCYPKIFQSGRVNIRSISWVRTFWEKVCILHSKSSAKTINSKYSRHYYDVYCIYSSPKYKKQLLEHLPELKKVISFRQTFYYSRSAHYEKMLQGKISLIPNSNIVGNLEKDYEKMQEMLHDGSKPKFNDVLETLKLLENELNAQIKNLWIKK